MDESCLCRIVFEIEEEPDVTFEPGNPVIIADVAPPYEGPYEVTPTRNQQTISTNGKRMTENFVVTAIPDTYYTAEEALELLFPVGSIYMSTSSTAPSFGGTWSEITIPLSWDDVKDGTRNYTDAAGTGTVHLWRRTA